MKKLRRLFWAKIFGWSCKLSFKLKLLAEFADKKYWFYLKKEVPK